MTVRIAKAAPVSSWPVEQFSQEILAELRAGGYTPAAWRRFFRRSWERSRRTAAREQALVASWRRLTVACYLGAALPIVLAWRCYGPRAIGMGGAALAGLSLQQADAYVHLGLNRRLTGSVLLPELGLPTMLSYMRGSVAYVLLASELARTPLPGLPLAALLVGSATDVADGRLARALGCSTKLGAYADGEADLVLALALTLTGIRRGTLPPSSGWLLAGRYALPIVVAFGVAFATERSPSIEHSIPGEVCGIAASALTALALAPSSVGRGLAGTRRRLYPLFVALNLGSGLVQVARIVTEAQALRALPGEAERPDLSFASA